MVMCDGEEEERCLCGMTMSQLHVHITAPFFLSSLPSLFLLLPSLSQSWPRRSPRSQVLLLSCQGLVQDVVGSA